MKRSAKHPLSKCGYDSRPVSLQEAKEREKNNKAWDSLKSNPLYQELIERKKRKQQQS
jgi:hypothetical protein